MTPKGQPVLDLRSQRPDLSAHQTLSRAQTVVLTTAIVVLVGALILDPVAAAVALFAGVTALYLLTFSYRAYLVWLALRQHTPLVVSDEDARGVLDQELPVYTVLVPLYHEAAVVARTVAALARLDYPVQCLDVKLLLEADDRETAAAVGKVDTDLPIEVVTVPPGSPRTKPKACNVGLRRAHGEFVTIYDAEDRPEPLQLRRAVVAFRRMPESVACLQAKLSYYNPRQNLITRWFTAEYATWFSLILPALVSRSGPVPLGGTSMHIRRAVLERVGAWDAYNVTEDADLGVRLQRLGYRVAVLDSTTMEEANSDFVNWVRQRSRWYKGYLQTWLVHMRHPLRLWREIGPSAFAGLNLLLGAVPFLALVNPLFWLLTAVWFLLRPHTLALLLPPPIYYPGLVSMVVGNFLALYVSLVGIRATRHPELLPATLLSPLYWVMMSLAAIRAFLQLVISPSFWDKSVHGLDRRAVLPVTERVSR